MKKLISYTILLCSLSCSRGVWVSENVYRPKKPKFKILSEPFKPNDLVNTKYIYISKKDFENYNGNKIIGYMGFYDDGRMIVDNTFENEMLVTVNNKNSFNTASSIGYYRLEGDRIKIEYFVPGDGGHYQMKKGIVKNDSLILFGVSNVLLKKDAINDTLIRSKFQLK